MQGAPGYVSDTRGLQRPAGDRRSIPESTRNPIARRLRWSPMTAAPCFPPNPILAHWHTLAHPAVCQGEPVCHPSVPAQPTAPVARRWCRSTRSARAVRFRWSRRPAPAPFTHHPTSTHLGTLAHPGTPVPTAGVPGSANSNRLKVRLRRFPAPTAEVISGLAHWHTCISFFY